MLVAGLLRGLLAGGDSGPMRTVEVNAGQVIRTIRSLQGVNGGPLGIVPPAPEVSQQYRDLRIDLDGRFTSSSAIDFSPFRPETSAIGQLARLATLRRNM
jgi:hypothetical protein